MEESSSDTKDSGNGDGSHGPSSSDASRTSQPMKLDSSDLLKLPGDDDQDELELAREKGKSDSEIFKELKGQLK